MSPADSFGIELTNPISATLLAERLVQRCECPATVSAVCCCLDRCLNRSSGQTHQNLFL
ncbi:MAG: hypothetical protein N838_04550 [Thiohalocapsa sp. PB-PSB1]|nr:MAG: hypothetical protein N838_04550 [Thiohalocapsa sp. PB-PSB1]